jgi:fimbrial chaperone protein
MASPLKLASQQSRAQRNIGLVLPVLEAATLYVVVGSEPGQTRGPEWFLTESPTRGRFCVTTSETEAAFEVAIVYPDGGDYITREHLACYRRAK